jgi:hypothetical protein
VRGSWLPPLAQVSMNWQGALLFCVAGGIPCFLTWQAPEKANKGENALGSCWIECNDQEKRQCQEKEALNEQVLSFWRQL